MESFRKLVQTRRRRDGRESQITFCCTQKLTYKPPHHKFRNKNAYWIASENILILWKSIFGCNHLVAANISTRKYTKIKFSNKIPVSKSVEWLMNIDAKCSIRHTKWTLTFDLRIKITHLKPDKRLGAVMVHFVFSYRDAFVSFQFSSSKNRDEGWIFPS